MGEQSLRDVIQESQAGNRDAFRAVFDRSFDAVYRYLLARLSARDDALDLAQDTFLDVWQGGPRVHYRSDRQFYGYIFIIAKRKLARHYATASSTLPLDEARIENASTPEIEDYRYLMNLIAHLKSKYQELIRLRYWGGLSFKEIAAALGITETTAKVWHHRALRTLQKISEQQ